jgi:hypothetical protein
MVHEGLDRYHYDRVAFDYTEKNYALFMDDWKTKQHDNEQYHAWGGNGGGDTHYTWGALLCLVGLEQYIDENPWDGLRFGSLSHHPRALFEIRPGRITAMKSGSDPGLPRSHPTARTGSRRTRALWCATTKWPRRCSPSPLIPPAA